MAAAKLVREKGVRTVCLSTLTLTLTLTLGAHAAESKWLDTKSARRYLQFNAGADRGDPAQSSLVQQTRVPSRSPLSPLSQLTLTLTLNPQVSMIGFEMTMGATYVPYILSDTIALPVTSMLYYTEKAEPMLVCHCIPKHTP